MVQYKVNRVNRPYRLGKEIGKIDEKMGLIKAGEWVIVVERPCSS